MRKIMLLLMSLITATFIVTSCVVKEKEVVHQPPPPRIEERGVPPGPNYAWVPGYWEWNDDDND